MARLVVGIDGSPEADVALRWAAEEAGRRQWDLDVVHAWSDAPVGAELFAPARALASVREAAHAVLDAAVDTAAHYDLAAPPHPQLVRSPADTALFEASEGADLLVVGRRGRGGFSGLLLGSTSDKMVRHATANVAVVRAVPCGASASGIVVGVDASAPALAALRWALEEASVRSCPLTVVRAWSYLDDPERDPGAAPGLHRKEDGALLRLQRLVDDEASAWPDVDVHAVMSCDAPTTALLAAASGASLLVVGSRGQGGFRELLLGSVTQQVLHHSPTTVVVVRSEGTPFEPETWDHIPV